MESAIFLALIIIAVVILKVAAIAKRCDTIKTDDTTLILYSRLFVTKHQIKLINKLSSSYHRNVQK